jgi:hypothetical protein
MFELFLLRKATKKASSDSPTRQLAGNAHRKVGQAQNKYK